MSARLSARRKSLQTKHLHPFYIQRIQYLEPADVGSRLDFCHWINSNPHMIRNIFFNDETHFTRDGVNNIRNSRLLYHDHLHTIFESNYQHSFSVNV